MMKGSILCGLWRRTSLQDGKRLGVVGAVMNVQRLLMLIGQICAPLAFKRQCILTKSLVLVIFLFVLI